MSAPDTPGGAAAAFTTHLGETSTETESETISRAVVASAEPSAEHVVTESTGDVAPSEAADVPDATTTEERSDLAAADDAVPSEVDPTAEAAAGDADADSGDDAAADADSGDEAAVDADASGEDDAAPGDEGTSNDEAEQEADDLMSPTAMCQLLFVDVVLLLPSTHPVVVLQEADPPYRELRIPVGGAEGIAIGYTARGLKTPRPLTHELLTTVLDTFGLTLELVQITAVRGSAYRELVVSGRSGAEYIDCRPSDAIALALRQRLPVPIMAAPEVLDAAGGDPAGAN